MLLLPGDPPAELSAELPAGHWCRCKTRRVGGAPGGGSMGAGGGGGGSSMGAGAAGGMGAMAMPAGATMMNPAMMGGIITPQLLAAMLQSGAMQGALLLCRAELGRLGAAACRGAGLLPSACQAHASTGCCAIIASSPRLAAAPPPAPPPAAGMGMNPAAMQGNLGQLAAMGSMGMPAGKGRALTGGVEWAGALLAGRAEEGWWVAGWLDQCRDMQRRRPAAG